MKRQLLFLTAFAIVMLPGLALAGVAGSDHDMRAGGESLCFACHIPHNALGDNLWASTPSGTFIGMQDLCYTCHDGVIATAGSDTAFDADLQQHKIVGTDCSGGGACHDVHDNTNGQFLTAGVVLTNGSYCETCHDGTQWTGAEALGDHTAGITHVTGVVGTGGTLTCNGCHTAHGATAQTTNPSGLTHPILLADNQPGLFYGAFCISCHFDTAPVEAIPGTGGVRSADPWNYAEATADGTESMHPSTTANVGGCDLCHKVHEPLETASKYILAETNANSSYCFTCHDGTGTGNAPGIGSGTTTHYTGTGHDAGMNSSTSPFLPWADEVDEDGVVGADWVGSGATADMMICESCHSVHRQGFTGVGAAYFLREANSTANEVCSECHTSN